jgi:hypothetical protein
MSLETILVVNRASGCDTVVEQQVTVTGYQCFLVRIPPQSNALGPFDVYTGSTGTTAVYTSQTREEMIAGVTICFGTIPPSPSVTPSATPTPTPSVTPTFTPTPSVTPTYTPTATITPSPTATPGSSATPTTTPTPTVTPSSTGSLYSGYLLPEPQDGTSALALGQYMINAGAGAFFGYFNSGIPGTTSFASDMNLYVQYSGWTGSNGNFITNVVNFNGPIRQSAGSGVDTFGCPQDQYTFGTVEVTTSEINPNIKYFYSIWIPLAGVGGSMSNMTVNIGDGTPCSTNIGNGVISDPSLATINVTVPSGCAIPAGVYRVLWITGAAIIPPSIGSLPLASPLYFKGDTHA